MPLGLAGTFTPGQCEADREYWKSGAGSVEVVECRARLGAGLPWTVCEAEARGAAGKACPHQARGVGHSGENRGGLTFPSISRVLVPHIILIL